MRPPIYLSGLDWFIHALDSATRRTSPAGNHSQVVLELAGGVDAAVLEAALQRFAAAFPVLGGRVARRWTLEPCWKLPRRGASVRIRLEAHRAEPGEAFGRLEQFANTPFRHAREYVVFHCLHLPGDRSFVAMVFDHRLLDARGAEQWLGLLGRYVAGKETLEGLRDACLPVRPSLLNRWRERFLGGRAVLRAMRSFAGGRFAGFATEGACGGGSSFIHLPLDEAESRRFLDRADREAGYLMLLPYALMAALRAFDALLRHGGRQGGGYLVPCTIDLRGADAPLRETFFNHCSLLFFRAGPDGLQDRPALAASLRRQFYTQCKEGFPVCFEQVTALMRILPVRLFDRIVCRHMRHCFGSFSFASVGASAFREDSFCGAAVVNLFHLPHVPPQTGIGFFFSQYRGRINIGVSFRKGLVDGDGRRKVLETLREMV